MSSNDFPALRMTVDGGRLVPATPFDQERINSYRRGAAVLVKITDQKDRVLVRKWFAILGLVLKQCKTPWKTKEEAHEAIKLALGIVNLSKTVSGAFMQYPKSLADLDDPELQEALDQMIALLSHLTGVDVETLNKEAAHVGSEFRQNTGSPSQADQPDTDEDRDASSLSSSEEDAGVNPPSAPASSDDQERLKLIRYARDVLPKAADPDANGNTLKAIENRWADDIAKLSDDGRMKAKGIAVSMRAIFNGSTSLESAAEFYAEALETTVGVILGREDV